MTKNNQAVNGTEVTFTVTPLTGKQLAELYGVGIKTFNRWLSPFKSEIGSKTTRYYTIAQVKTIIKYLGMPGTIIRE
ncbi:MAG: hypothetical protein ACHQD8_01395 [Chitinophagales bacterium]